MTPHGVATTRLPTRVASTCRQVRAGSAKVKRGKDLGVARASNKGAVGAAFRFYSDCTVAVACCHLAADKKGKANREKRAKDLRHLLNDLELEYDDVDYDLQLSCHHLILLGVARRACLMTTVPAAAPCLLRCCAGCGAVPAAAPCLPP